MKKLLLVSFLVCMGCDSSVSDARQAIEDKLLDPGSVQYRKVQAYPGGRVCGQLNAKNSMGGYIGFKDFVYVKGDLMNSVNTDASTVEIISTCRSASEDKNTLDYYEEQCKKNTDQLALDCQVAEKIRLRLDKRSKSL